MLRNTRIILTAFIVILVTTGCEKFLDFEGENAKPRLVLNGIFSPDSVFSVELSNSQGYVNNGALNTISTGQAFVYNSTGNIIDTLNHTTDGIYRGNTIALAGETYTVQASAGAYGTVSSTDYLPAAVEIASWDTNTVSVTEYDYTSQRTEISITINDPGTTENFYILEIVSSNDYYLSYNIDPVTGEEVLDTIYFDNPNAYKLSFSTADPVLLSEVDQSLNEALYYSSSLTFSDALFNGRSQTFKVLVDGYQFSQNSSPLNLNLTSCSEAYYKYQRTLESYFYTQGDPFAQPVQVYNNIENGLGIWAGYSLYSEQL